MAAQLEKSDPAIYNITPDIPRMDIAIQTLSKRSMFWRPVYLAQSAWLEHIPFAFWLMEAHRPRMLVELGVHYGVSYFAFCQAVDRLGLDTRCFGVDTFKGDEHAGAYGENVFEQVRSHNDLQYSGFSRIVRSTFDDALKHFSDGSVDLLHIDGLHTIEAVRHDFESWLPKLSKRAIVIMHDTNVRERNFGVFKLFDGLKQKYPHFEFVHGHGLGVLGVGEEQNELMQLLFHASDNEHSRQSVQEVFSRLGQACSSALSASSQREHAKLLSVSIEKQKKQLDQANQSLEKKNEDIDVLGKELATAKETIRTQLQQYAMERDHFVERANLFQELRNELKDEVVRLQGKIEALSVELQLKDQELSVFNRERSEYQRQMGSVTAQLNERDQLISSLNEKLSLHLALEKEQDDAVKKLSDEKTDLAERLAERDLFIADLHKTIEEERKETSHASNLLRAHEAELEKMHSTLQQSWTDLEKLREENECKTSEIFTLKQTLNSHIEDFNVVNENLATHIREVDHLKKIIDSKNSEQFSLQENIAQLQSKNERLVQEVQALIADKDKQAEDLEDSAKKFSSLRKMLEERDAILQEKGREAKAQEKRLDDRFKEIAELTKIIEERELLLKAKDKDIAACQQRASKLDSELKAKTEVLKTHEKQLAETKAQAQKDAALAQQQAEQQKLKSELQAKTETAKNVEKQLAETKVQAAKAQAQKDAALTQLQAEQQKLKNELQAKTETAKNVEKQLAETKAQAAKAQAQKDAALAQLQAEQQKLKNELQMQSKRLEDRFHELAALTKLLEERDRALVKKDSELQAEKQHMEKVLNPLMALSSFEESTRPETMKVEKKDVPGIREQIFLIEKSGLFDKSWYLSQYPDVAESRMNPIQHYILHGASEGRMPGPNFDTQLYVQKYPNLLKERLNPLVHYIKNGMNKNA